jgi:hypothetical protein
MTNHTDLEISKALALAIGWKEVIACKGFLRDKVEVWVKEDNYDSDWRAFDYRDWNVIGPIAERYDCFPAIASCHNDEWHSMYGGSGPSTYADTPQKATAMAVIGARK